ncbi:MAG: dTDP-4-dehydrorhamnose 3,5-epimerase [Bacteroidales bacterium]|nr:dTDP-4-dehydrorhamnose 3,5-epimerase [Bacteroidales bacterium]
MNFIPTKIPDVIIIEPKVFYDARGYFYESYKKAIFDSKIGKFEVVQENESKSTYGVLRGIHFQKGDNAQAKLVRVLKGKVIDVAIDLRKSSLTFAKYVMVELSDENKHQLFVPRGFGHAYLVLSDEAVFTYKVDNVYAPQAEGSVLFCDPTLDIKWPIAKEKMILSDKDIYAPLLENADLFD